MGHHATAAQMLRGQLEPLQPYLDRSNVFEVVVNMPGVVWVETRSGWLVEKVPGLTLEMLRRLAVTTANFTGQSIDEVHPLLSATLPGGERIQIVIPPAVTPGTVSVTIRKPSATTFTLLELARTSLFSNVAINIDPIHETTDQLELSTLLYRLEYATFLARAVRLKQNIIIAGATGSGKTTLSKALIQLIPDHERIITIEDTRELEIPQPNHVRLFYSKGNQGTSAIRAKDLLEACLRMRPDRIMLQELRDGTAFDYLRNVNSGHPGSITTVHANSCALAFEQLTLLVKESEGGRGLDRYDIRQMLEQLVDVVVQCKRVDGQFRVTEIWFSGDAKRAAALT
jgi:type IV secretion system protein VirB11